MPTSQKDTILDGLFSKVECCHVRLNQHPESIFIANISVVDYRHQDDETVASRGSISMKMAVLRDTERTRFEIHSVLPGHITSTQDHRNGS